MIWPEGNVERLRRHLRLHSRLGLVTQTGTASVRNASGPGRTLASRASPAGAARTADLAMRRSAIGVVQAHLVERALEDRKVLVVESLEEQLRHALEMDGHRLDEPRHAGCRQPHDDSPAV